MFPVYRDLLARLRIRLSAILRLEQAMHLPFILRLEQATHPSVIPLKGQEMYRSVILLKGRSIHRSAILHTDQRLPIRNQGHTLFTILQNRRESNAITRFVNATGITTMTKTSIIITSNMHTILTT